MLLSTREIFEGIRSRDPKWVKFQQTPLPWHLQMPDTLLLSSLSPHTLQPAPLASSFLENAFEGLLTLFPTSWALSALLLPPQPGLCWKTTICRPKCALLSCSNSSLSQAKSELHQTLLIKKNQGAEKQHNGKWRQPEALSSSLCAALCWAQPQMGLYWKQSTGKQGSWSSPPAENSLLLLAEAFDAQARFKCQLFVHAPPDFN